jgi:hypothetical protein
MPTPIVSLMKIAMLALVILRASGEALVTESKAVEPTVIEVRVLSKGAKFVGTSMGGASVLIRDADSGELLAQGVTQGSTGDTDRIMVEPRRKQKPLATADAAVFRAELDLQQPRQIEVQASGPRVARQATNTVRVTQWVVPGKHLDQGDGLLLELPGLVVNILSPPVATSRQGVPQSIELHANVTTMCGCPITPGGLWDADQYEIQAVASLDGQHVASCSMEYAGEASQFKGVLQIDQSGVYEVLLYAYDPRNGNTGLDRVTFIVRE